MVIFIHHAITRPEITWLNFQDIMEQGPLQLPISKFTPTIYHTSPHEKREKLERANQTIYTISGEMLKGISVLCLLSSHPKLLKHIN